MRYALKDCNQRRGRDLNPRSLSGEPISIQKQSFHKTILYKGFEDLNLVL